MIQHRICMTGAALLLSLRMVETKEMPLEEIYQRFIGSVVMVAGR